MRLGALDANKVASFMFHPELFDDMSDDHSDAAWKKGGRYYEINVAKTLLTLPQVCVFLHPNRHVLFMMTLRTNTLWEVHTMIMPEGRGKEAVEATRGAAKWFFENSKCEKIITYIPVFNRKAKLFAKLVGMKEEGICTKSFKKHNQLHDQWFLGLEKETICLQEQQ